MPKLFRPSPLKAVLYFIGMCCIMDKACPINPVLKCIIGLVALVVLVKWIQSGDKD